MMKLILGTIPSYIHCIDVMQALNACFIFPEIWIDAAIVKVTRWNFCLIKS